MHHPLQCIQAVSNLHTKQTFLVAAAGSGLFTYSLEDGRLLSSWRHCLTNATSTEDVQHPASKKRKVSASSKPKDKAGKSLDKSTDHEHLRELSDAPYFIKIAVSPSRQYLATVTDEDKCVRVFGISGGGVLQPMSARFFSRDFLDVCDQRLNRVTDKCQNGHAL